MDLFEKGIWCQETKFQGDILQVSNCKLTAVQEDRVNSSASPPSTQFPGPERHSAVVALLSAGRTRSGHACVDKRRGLICKQRVHSCTDRGLNSSRVEKARHTETRTGRTVTVASLVSSRRFSRRLPRNKISSEDEPLGTWWCSGTLASSSPCPK